MLRIKPNLVVPALLLALGACSSKAGPAPNDTGQDVTRADAAPDAAILDLRLDASHTCPIVQTTGGPVQGEGRGACSYLGIPYAAPPVGPLRWKPPQPAAPWATPRPSQAGNGCPQVGGLWGARSTNEDCLFLNVWTPPAHAAPAPVMIFVHGSGYVGSGMLPLWNGTNLAATAGVVVVTLNYRLGALGFLSNPDLRSEDPGHPSAGNYGLEDQIAAFKWMKQNAAAFGGDPATLTIFGQSMGGAHMFAHLVSPKSKGLFDRVIVHSGVSWNGTQIALPTAVADKFGAGFASKLGCTDPSALLSCLRGKSVDAVLNAANAVFTTAGSFYWGYPVVDGFVLPDEPLKLFASGAFTKVPTMIGDTRNDGSWGAAQGYYSWPQLDQPAYQAFAEDFFPGHGAAIVTQYPVSAFGNSYPAAAGEALTDGRFVCPARRVARACAAAAVPTFRFDFARVIAHPSVPALGAYHNSDLLFVFGSSQSDIGHLEPVDQPLSHAMMAYWGAMAANGDPNGSGRYVWPKYDLATETNIVLDLTMSTETALKKKQCDFWDSLAP